MANRLYPDEFKTETVKQVTNPGYKPVDVAERLGVATKRATLKINTSRYYV
ncbi:MAG: transposase-like protein [Oceanospirillaceae bacterium]|jgi:transposase-like protein